MHGYSMMADVQSTMRIKFDDLTQGWRSGIVIDPTYLSAITNTGFYQARDAIADKIQEIFEDIEEQTTKNISLYTISQVLIRDDVDPYEPKSWKAIPHLYQDWESLKERGCGQDASIVIAIVTERDTPTSRDGSQYLIKPEQYSTAICHELNNLFKIVHKDQRLLLLDDAHGQLVTTTQPIGQPQSSIIHITITFTE